LAWPFDTGFDESFSPRPSSCAALNIAPVQSARDAPLIEQHSRWFGLVSVYPHFPLAGPGAFRSGPDGAWECGLESALVW
jgi:hypothetical protein